MVAVVLVGCSADPEQAGGETAAPATYGTAPELMAAITAQQVADRSWRTTYTQRQEGGTTGQQSEGEAAERRDERGVSSHSRTTGQSGGVSEVLTLPDETFVRAEGWPGTSEAQPWARYPSRDPESPARGLGALVVGLQALSTPAAYLEAFEPVETITGTTPEPVGEVATVRYDITVALAEMDPADPALQPTVASLVRFAQGVGIDTATVQVWLDEQDRMQRVVSTMQLPEGGGGGSAVSDVTFHSWGAPVDIAPPPTEQVVQ